MKKSQLDMSADRVPNTAPLVPFSAALGSAGLGNGLSSAGLGSAGLSSSGLSSGALNSSAALKSTTLNSAVSAANAASAAVAGHTIKTEERRQNAPYFEQKPPMQTIPVKLPDNIIELLKGQARQRGVSLQTLIKATLAASVSSSVAEEQS